MYETEKQFLREVHNISKKYNMSIVGGELVHSAPKTFKRFLHKTLGDCLVCKQQKRS